MPLNILLADDSMTAQNMAKKILSEAGYEVTTVSNGAAALKKIADRTPDLAILDIYMPGYTGLEVCERVKRAAATSRMPVLLSVGKLEPYREQDATAVRADGVIVKPFEASELVTIVTNIILRTSGATMDAIATLEPPMRPAVSPVASQATTAMTPEVPPAIPAEYSAELANLDTQIQNIDPLVTYGSTTVTDNSYENTSLPPMEKALAMVAHAPVAAAETAVYPPISARAEANRSMPFMIDELLKAEEKVSEEDSARSFSGPPLDVSPTEQATEEDIEVIEIPAAQPEELDDSLVEHSVEPSAGAQVEEQKASSLSEVAGPQELIADTTGVSPDELTALEVEAFLLDHAPGAGLEPASTAVESGSDVHAQQADTAIAAKLHDSDTGPAEAANAAAEVVAEAEATQAPPLEVQAEPRIADDKPVFEVPAFDVEDEPYFALTAMNAAEGSPVVEEAAAQPYAENLLAAEPAPEAYSSTTASVAAVGGPEPAVEPPAVAVQDLLARKPEIQEPEPQPAAAPPPVTVESTAKPAPPAAEEFMFSVPMMLEATAAMSLPEMPALASRPAFEPSATATFGAPTYAAEAARPAALDEAAIAGVVQRVLDRFKPQIVAEIVRELAKHRR